MGKGLRSHISGYFMATTALHSNHILSPYALRLYLIVCFFAIVLRSLISEYLKGSCYAQELVDALTIPASLLDLGMLYTLRLRSLIFICLGYSCSASLLANTQTAIAPLASLRILYQDGCASVCTDTLALPAPLIECCILFSLPLRLFLHTNTQGLTATRLVSPVLATSRHTADKYRRRAPPAYTASRSLCSMVEGSVFQEQRQALHAALAVLVLASRRTPSLPHSEAHISCVVGRAQKYTASAAALNSGIHKTHDGRGRGIT